MQGRVLKRERKIALATAPVAHGDNEWGISLASDDAVGTTEVQEQKETFVEVKKEQTLEELMKSMKALQASK